MINRKPHAKTIAYRTSDETTKNVCRLSFQPGSSHAEHSDRATIPFESVPVPKRAQYDGSHEIETA
jgi:hypothetical protein